MESRNECFLMITIIMIASFFSSLFYVKELLEIAGFYEDAEKKNV